MSDAQDPFLINCWSGPRCCSTSLMYAFAQRPDAQVVDEPLYASYVKLTGVDRPYKVQLLQAQENDPNKAFEELLAPRPKKILYAKHMGKQKMGVNQELLRRACHMLLVREPYAVVQSYSKVVEPTFMELGYGALVELYSDLRSIGRPPIVILSDDLVRDPEPLLQAVCAAMGLPWVPAMLSWEAGPKPYDGVWAPWWYANTHKATGFSASVREKREPLPERMKQLLGECWPFWEMLRQHAIRPSQPLVPRPLPTADVEGTAVATAAAGPQGKRGTHVYVPDPRNADILVGMRDGITGMFDLVHRPQARVSVLDSAFMLGDGVWEGIRCHCGVLVCVREHLERLWEGAKAIDMDLAITQKQLQQLIYETLEANDMGAASGVHIRLMVSRGLKPTPYQNPATTIGHPTIVILPEWKEAAPGPKEQGIRLFTCHIVRGPPNVQDPMWNSHSKLNCIAACIQANKAGADEALMLDPHGFVATCNSTNFMCVRKGEVWAPSARYQLHGITRANVMRLAAAAGMTVRELDFSLTQAYSADEAFVTGTFAGLIPVSEVDGRVIGPGTRGPITARLQQLYMEEMEAQAALGRIQL